MALALVTMGLALLGAVGAYHGYGVYARSELDQLNFSIEDLTTPQSPSVADAAESVRPLSLVPYRPGQAASGQSRSEPSRADGRPSRFPPSPFPPSPFPPSSFASIYPGAQLHPKYWGEPMWAGTDLRQALRLPDGFRAVSDVRPPSTPGTTWVAQRIRIPAIGVNSDVTELGIVDLGDSLAYETPDNVVGHIPETVNPGEAGNGWFFGHLESPFNDEGNVFRRLPEIPTHLRNGDPVYVSIESGVATYLYQVIATQVVQQDDLGLYDSDNATITLVACVPRLIYDHRLLVSAKLVGVKE